MKSMPKSLEVVEQEDFFLNSKGVIKILFHQENIYVKVRNQRFSLNETPSVIINGKKTTVVGII